MVVVVIFWVVVNFFVKVGLLDVGLCRWWLLVLLWPCLLLVAVVAAVVAVPLLLLLLMRGVNILF